MTQCSVTNLEWGETWPSRELFQTLADEGYRIIPIVRRLLADSITPVGFYERLANGRSGTFILESAEYGGSWSRYSFISALEPGRLDRFIVQSMGLSSNPCIFSVRNPPKKLLGSTKALEENCNGTRILYL